MHNSGQSSKARMLLFILAISLWSGDACGQEKTQPNIVIVYTDDQAAWAFGTAVQQGWYNDVPRAHTPNLDRLAREGAVFRNFFCTTPVCSPARATFMTGRYASEFGITDFIPQPGHKLYDAGHQVALNPAASVTFAELLQFSRYKTGLVGKWHLGDWTAAGNERFHPTRHGFDYFMGLTGGGTKPGNPDLEEDGAVRRFIGLTTDILTDRAMQFIERSQTHPFLLCLNTRAPHGAWLPVAPEDWIPYATLDAKIPNPDYPDLDIAKMKKQMREYLASTTGIDRNLGRILNLLDELKLTDNTIVIFTSDHGFNMGHNGIWHKGNGIWATHQSPTGMHHDTRVISDRYRPNLYDHSLRVPMIVRWPSVINPGTTISDTATSLDIFPTLATMAGVQLPKGLPLRGRNLLALVQGETPADWNQNLYAEYHMINYVKAELSAYRTPRFKLVIDSHNTGRNEFYDLLCDPNETQNLYADQRPEIQTAIADLSQRIRQQSAAVRASATVPAAQQ